MIDWFSFVLPTLYTYVRAIGKTIWMRVFLCNNLESGRSSCDNIFSGSSNSMVSVKMRYVNMSFYLKHGDSSSNETKDII